MPTNRKRRVQARRRPVEVLTEDQERLLLRGNCFFDGFPDRETMQRAWEAHRERLLAAWVARHPGSRPFAWWLFEGVPRYGERPVICPRFRAEDRANWLCHGIMQTHTTLQEPEVDFLDRHGELSAAKREAAKALGWDDEAIFWNSWPALT